MAKTQNYLIKNGLVYDGSGETPRTVDIAVSGGLVTEIGPNLTPPKSAKVIDAKGKWVMPGLVDVHTHYDLELEIAPGLPESVRHGTTTVVMSNCSLGLAFGAQRNNGDDPVVSCFARVENIPKPLLKTAADKIYWNNSGEYLDHLDKLVKGPNVVPMIPHSMLRIEAMGLSESVSRDPTDDEMEVMKGLLKTGMEQGYAGFSTDALPFHFLANDPNRQKQIPTQFAKYGELKTLTKIVRDHDRVWQATPPKDSPVGTLKTFLLTSGRLHGKPLKTTVVAAMDIYANRNIVRLGKTLARLLNSRLLNGKFYMQALAAPFKIWADHMYSPLSEEIDELREIVEIDLEDKEARERLLSDPDYIARFKKMWMTGKTGFGSARLRRKLRLEDYAFRRDIDEMMIEACPVASWEGLSFGDVYRALKSGAIIDKGFAKYESHFEDVSDEANFVLAMLRAFDLDLIWSAVSANRDPALTKKLLMNPLLLPGFNDSGAHLTNMAFYDCNLRALKIASEDGLDGVSYMVRRLTKDVSDIFGIKAGTITVGAPADITMINPDMLANYDGEAKVKRIYREEFQHDQLVNRSDGVVDLVMINGIPAWEIDGFTKDFAKAPMGRLLRAG
ncbi:MAG: amidohydrolase family protein [Hellea sp.]|nr:amidohydrolase family protein [Hellea sp.]